MTSARSGLLGHDDGTAFVRLRVHRPWRQGLAIAAQGLVRAAVRRHDRARPRLHLAAASPGLAGLLLATLMVHRRAPGQGCPAWRVDARYLSRVPGACRAATGHVTGRTGLHGVPARRAAVRLIGAGLVGWLAAGCGGQASPSPANSIHASPASSPAAPHAAAPGAVTKILVIVEENHGVGEVFPTGMPYLWHLARRYGYAADYSAITHPSLPNYLAIFTGSAFNDPPDCSPGPGCTYPGPSVFGQALARGKTARAYEESMPAPCDHSDSGDYAVRHNPWAYIPAEAAAYRADDVPVGTPTDGALASDVRAGILPNVGLLTPNLIDDAHDGTRRQADAFLRQWIPVITSGPDWRHRRLAIAVVFDEAGNGNQVPFVLIAPGLPGTILHQPLDHFALTRLIDTIIGAPPLRQAASAPDLAQQLGLKVG
jgi:phosphatidylinositol-3-phosphatase